MTGYNWMLFIVTMISIVSLRLGYLYAKMDEPSKRPPTDCVQVAPVDDSDGMDCIRIIRGTTWYRDECLSEGGRWDTINETDEEDEDDGSN